MAPETCCDFDGFLKAMANETRQRILHLLREKELSVTALCAHFDLAQPTISHHLALLRQANLVTTRQVGKWVYYRANQDCVAECCQEIMNRFIPLATVVSSSKQIKGKQIAGAGCYQKGNQYV